MYVRGDNVRVYEDPITEKKLEGEARLVEMIEPENQDGFEIWKVRFLNERDNYVRTIKAQRLSEVK